MDRCCRNDWATEARVEISGICGEVTGEMVLRFRAAVLNRRPQTVVILGGTNDLGWNADPDGDHAESYQDV